MDWQTVELLGYTHYSSQGFTILTALVRNDGYDFVAEKDGDFIRVNVKCAGLKDKTNPDSWCISEASGSKVCASRNGRAKKSKVDVYLTYLPQHGRFLELPGDFFDGSVSKSKRIPKHFLK
ncbi:group I intron-associated PD-(D/E)XK endonuclease [Pseudomonas sp.]|uniref:group I intron-associated PD-(D/E)XK endonuclease n=1 Tax=Pseudomonas sp. TaxID=306 RepID=UPI00338DB331